MLVLSRKSGEKIHVGEDVVIEIKRITGSRVTIAIDAPRDVRILRGELVEQSATTPPVGAAGQPAAKPPVAPVKSPSITACLVTQQPVDASDVGPSILGS